MKAAALVLSAAAVPMALAEAAGGGEAYRLAPASAGTAIVTVRTSMLVFTVPDVALVGIDFALQVQPSS